MSPPDIDELFRSVRSADPDVMGSDELAELTGRVAQLRSWCESVQVRATRRQRQLADEGRADEPRNTMCREGRRSAKDARAAAERERVCTSIPGVEEALNDGAIASGHVDALAQATSRLDDSLQAEFAACADDLLADAARQGVDAFGRSCRELARHLARASAETSEADELDRQREAANVRRWVDRETGMHHTHLELDPVRDRALWTAIERCRATLRQQDGNRRTPWEQLTVDAVVGAIGGGNRTERVPEITVLIDLDTLMGLAGTAGVCETDDGTPLPVSTVRRLCCDAEVLPVVLDGERRALDVGRSRRTATWPQRQALRAMHRTCAHPECSATFDMCRIHHLVPWKRGGPTDIDNLVPLCEQHHHQVHEGGWGFTMTPGRDGVWSRPDGTVQHVGTTIDRPPSRPAAA
jgi:hypothetical protein